MKISLDDIKRLQSDQTDVLADEPKAKKVKESKAKGRFSGLISKTVMIEDDDSVDIVVASDETVDLEAAKLPWVKWVLMTLAYLGAIAVTTILIMRFLNTPDVGLIDGITPQAITNDDHQIILRGSYDEFDTLVDIYGGGQALESDDIIVDAPEVSDEAYEKRIENLREELRQSKEKLDQVLEGLEEESDPNVIPETIIEYVPSIDMTNDEIVRLNAALTASKAVEKDLRKALQEAQEALREAQGTP